MMLMRTQPAESRPYSISSQEWESLRSQFATLRTGRGQHRKFLPYVFTEHGALMAANVLNSPRAIEMSIFLVRTFVELRQAADWVRDASREVIRCAGDCGMTRRVIPGLGCPHLLKPHFVTSRMRSG